MRFLVGFVFLFWFLHYNLGLQLVPVHVIHRLLPAQLPGHRAFQTTLLHWPGPTEGWGIAYILLQALQCHLPLTLLPLYLLLCYLQAVLAGAQVLLVTAVGGRQLFLRLHPLQQWGTGRLCTLWSYDMSDDRRGRVHLARKGLADLGVA